MKNVLPPKPSELHINATKIRIAQINPKLTSMLHREVDKLPDSILKNASPYFKRKISHSSCIRLVHVETACHLNQLKYRARQEYKIEQERPDAIM